MSCIHRISVCVFVALLCAVSASCKNGKDTESAAEVKPTRPPSPSGTMSLRGNYEYLGSIGEFEDCTTRQKWRVSREGDHVALEEAYIDSAVPLGEPLLVLVEGGIDLRASPGRPGQETMLIVARYVESWPGEECPAADPE